MVAGESRGLLTLETAEGSGLRAFSWSRLNPFRRRLHLDDETAGSLVALACDHLNLLKRHGWVRLVEFYESELTPALRASATNEQGWRALFEVGCRTAAILGRHGHLRETNKVVRLLIADVARAGFSERENQNFAIRKQVRHHLGDSLRDALDRPVRSTTRWDLRDAYALLDSLGGLDDAHLMSKYASLLWEDGERGDDAVGVYVRCLDDWGTIGMRRSTAAEMQWHVSDRMRISDGHQPADLRERVRLNLASVASGSGSTECCAGAGLGYYMMGDLAKSVHYLGTARALTEREAALDSGSGQRDAPTPGHSTKDIAFYLGRALFKNGDAEHAQLLLDESVDPRKRPRSTVDAWIGLTLAELGRWEEALATFERADVGLGDVSRGDFYLQWGRACFLCGRTSDAEEKLRAALTHGDGGAGSRAVHALAVCMIETDRCEECVSLLREHPVVLSEFAPAVHLLGRALEERGDLQGAEEAYGRAVALCPDDAEYNAALGLVMGDDRRPEALPFLRTAASAGAGGSEVLRRLAAACRESGDSAGARRWTAALAEREPSCVPVVRIQSRELATLATESHNAGRFARAENLWWRVLEASGEDAPQSEPVRERLALALIRRAMLEHRQAAPDRFLASLDKAHALASTDETELYSAIACLIRGDAAHALEGLIAVQERVSDRGDLDLIIQLARALSGEALDDNVVASIRGSSNEDVVHLLRVQCAVSTGDNGAAKSAVESWLDVLSSESDSGLGCVTLNGLVAFGSMRGSSSRLGRVTKYFERKQAGQPGSWDLATAVAKRCAQARKARRHQYDADMRELQDCDERFARAELHCVDSREREFVVGERHKTAFQKALHFARAEDWVSAARELRRIPGCEELVPGLDSQSVGKEGGQNRSAGAPSSAESAAALGELIDRRTREASHVRAYCAMMVYPDGAREDWEDILRRTDDWVALHHLACLAWSTACDLLLEGDWQASVEQFGAGIERFAQLYARTDYWSALQTKGEVLSATSHPFDEAAFREWRRHAMLDLSKSLLNELVMPLARTAGGRGEDDHVRQFAGEIVKAIDRAGLTDTERADLSAWIKARLLPSKTEMSDPEASIEVAELIVDMDPNNADARRSYVRLVTHQLLTKSEASSANFKALERSAERARPHAEWLTGGERRMPEADERQWKRDLADFWLQSGTVYDRHANRLVGEYNELGRAETYRSSRQRQILIETRELLQKSDDYLRRSLALYGLDQRPKPMLDHHEKLYGQIREEMHE